MVKIGALEEEIRPSQCALTEANKYLMQDTQNARFFVIKSVIKVCCRKN